MKNKIKTHKGLAKVLKKKKSGLVTFQPANKNHMTSHRSNASRRNRHHKSGVSATDYKRVKSII